ncbi:unnamed protein product [Polarella glacialis]|uniref:J domain-containing protein n=1 Tax=Polarella glacialis TaxID=89957 RepID=A0A813LSK1_POLGL|nr:unnamed protein product [Polarella glacialis]
MAMLQGVGGATPNLYQVLAVDMNADEEDIKASYRKLVQVWNPDKHPTDSNRYVRIRLMNDAYETLMSPLKRSTYDQMLAGLEFKRMGTRLNTQLVNPKINIPKEFVLCPLGSHDKFIRVVNEQLVVQSRDDALGAGFVEFFWSTRFTLWWMPDDMCRLSCQTWTGQGVDLKRQGATATKLMHLLLEFSAGHETDPTAEATVSLSPIQDIHMCNLTVSGSPFIPGAYRFQSAYCPGRYLTYRSPDPTLLMAPDTGNHVVDFLIVDYTKASNFMNVGEVIRAAVESQGGSHGDYVKLKDLRADHNVKRYFQQVLGKPVWSPQELETYFEGHSEEWDFSLQKARVRIRPGGPLDKTYNSKDEGKSKGSSKREASRSRDRRAVEPAKEVAVSSAGKDKDDGKDARKDASEETGGSLDKRLRTASGQMATVQVVMSAAGEDLAKLPFQTVPLVLQRLADTQAGVRLADITAARRRFLVTMPVLLGEGTGRAAARVLSITTLLGMRKDVAAIAGSGADLAEVCQSALETIAEVLGVRIRRVPVEVDLDMLPDIFALPMNWHSVAEALEEAVRPLLKKKLPADLLKPLKAAVAAKLPKDSWPVLGALARCAMKNVYEADVTVAADLLLTIAETGAEVAGVSSCLRPPLLQRLALADLISIVAALGEQQPEADVLRPALQSRVAVSGPALAAVPPEKLLRLARAARLSPVIAEVALGPVVGAVAASLGRWPASATAELLLVVATAVDCQGKSVAETSGAKRMIAAADGALTPHLKDEKLEMATLMRVIIGSAAVVGQSRGLLEKAATQAIVRSGELRPAQMMLVTQGVLPLGGSHPIVADLLDCWGERIGAGGYFIVPPDDLASLAALAVSLGSESQNLFYVIGVRLQEGLDNLTSSGRASLESAFPAGGGLEFPGKEDLLSKLAAGAAKELETEASTERDAKKPRVA